MVLVGPRFHACGGRHGHTAEQIEHGSFHLVEQLQRVIEALDAQLVDPAADQARPIEARRRIAVAGVVERSGDGVVVTVVDHERGKMPPAFLPRAQRAVDEQVGDHCTGRWLPTDGGCSSSRCRGVHASISSAGHTSCDHAELPGEYLYSKVRRCCGPATARCRG